MYLRDKNDFNVDFLDDLHASNSANSIPILDSSGKLPFAQIPTGTNSSSVAVGNHEHSYPYFGITNTTSSNGYGISLFNGPYGSAPPYGLMFQGTSTFGTHGAVTADWATYFTMSGATNRGWIFKSGTSNGGNVASISAGGTITANRLISSNSSGDLLQIENTGGGDAYIDIKRGSNADWRILNSGGTLYFQSNYTSVKGSYYNVFSLVYNSGDAVLKGNMSVPSISGVSTINMAKNGNSSKINFAPQSSDPGYIEHYENNNSSYLRFVVSTDSNNVDYFTWGSQNTSGTYTEGLRLYTSGLMEARNNITLPDANSIQKGGYSTSWILGTRGAGALVDLNTATGYNVAMRIKTTNGSWGVGQYTVFGDGLLVSYINDSKTENSVDVQYRFDPSGTISGFNSLDGVGSAGAWGSMDIGGSKESWAGFRFKDANSNYLLFHSDGRSGLWNSSGGAIWSFNGAGELDNGTVPAHRISGYQQKLTISDTRDTAPTPNDCTNFALSTFFTNTTGISGDWYSGLTVKGWSNGYTAWQLAAYSGTWSTNGLWFRTGKDTSWSSWYRIYHEGFLPNAYGTSAPSNGDGRPDGTIYVQY